MTTQNSTRLQNRHESHSQLGSAFHICFCFFLCFSWLITEVATAAEVSVRTVEDYAFGGYKGQFTSPPSADGNPRRAVIVEWAGRKERLVFWHEASYCPFFELADGSGVCFQFFEGNDGWAELFNQYGRMEKNSFVEVAKQSPQRVHIHWKYFGVNEKTGERAYLGTEDFYCFANGLVLRRQILYSLLAARNEGYAREPIELIGLCPVGKLWKDVLQADAKTDERHALAVLDPFSSNRYDVFWKPDTSKLWQATPRREGTAWKNMDDAAGVVLALPMRAGSPFCAFGTASGFDARTTHIKDHSYKDTGGVGWVSSSWDHWPVGWLNSQAHEVDSTSLTKYPNHFSPAGMDFFAVPNEQVARGEYWSLNGVGGLDLDAVRRTTRKWLDLGPKGCQDVSQVERLPAVQKSVSN